MFSLASACGYEYVLLRFINTVSENMILHEDRFKKATQKPLSLYRCAYIL